MSSYYYNYNPLAPMSHPEEDYFDSSEDSRNYVEDHSYNYDMMEEAKKRDDHEYRMKNDSYYAYKHRQKHGCSCCNYR
jgi:hypothetical protein